MAEPPIEESITTADDPLLGLCDAIDARAVEAATGWSEPLELTRSTNGYRPPPGEVTVNCQFGPSILESVTFTLHAADFVGSPLVYEEGIPGWQMVESDIDGSPAQVTIHSGPVQAVGADFKLAGNRWQITIALPLGHEVTKAGAATLVHDLAQILTSTDAVEGEFTSADVANSPHDPCSWFDADTVRALVGNPSLEDGHGEWGDSISSCTWWSDALADQVALVGAPSSVLSVEAWRSMQTAPLLDAELIEAIPGLGENALVSIDDKDGPIGGMLQAGDWVWAISLPMPDAFPGAESRMEALTGLLEMVRDRV